MLNRNYQRELCGNRMRRSRTKQYGRCFVLRTAQPKHIVVDIDHLSGSLRRTSPGYFLVKSSVSQNLST